MRSGTLAVAGADLYHQVRGSGPMLLLIGGSNVDTGLYDELAERLARHRTVVTYDRRGNSRSGLSDPPGEQRIEEHADDAHHLLRALTNEPVAVFGSGIGATIGLDLLARHPEQVGLLVAHEPIVTGLLPDPKRWRAAFDDVHDLYLRSGSAAAAQELVRLFGLTVPPVPDVELPGPIIEMMERVHANVEFSLAWELRSFCRYEVDLAALRGAPLRPVAGVEGPRTPLYRAASELAEQLDLPLRELPSDHMGYLAQPDEFARALIALLDEA
jgi:pimeloyl-ACP methyl ester carboxylesterase